MSGRDGFLAVPPSESAFFDRRKAMALAISRILGLVALAHSLALPPKSLPQVCKRPGPPRYHRDCAAPFGSIPTTRWGCEDLALCISSDGHVSVVGSRGEEKPTTSEHVRPEKDTVRVRIWRALASGDEVSMAQLSREVGESRGELRSHLAHVERQARTIANKSNEWLLRRGLPPIGGIVDGGAGGGPRKLRLKKRRGAKKQVFVRLVDSARGKS